MATLSCRTQRPVFTPRTQKILRVWRGDRCVCASAAQQYSQWIGRFKEYDRALGLDEPAELMRDGAKRFPWCWSIGFLDLRLFDLPRSPHRSHPVLKLKCWHPFER